MWVLIKGWGDYDRIVCLEIIIFILIDIEDDFMIYSLVILVSLRFSFINIDFLLWVNYIGFF